MDHQEGRCHEAPPFFVSEPAFCGIANTLFMQFRFPGQEVGCIDDTLTGRNMSLKLKRKMSAARILGRIAWAMFALASASASAAPEPAEERAIGPSFEIVLGVARLDADCYGRSPCAVPTGPSTRLTDELGHARWHIADGPVFVIGYREALTRYLIEQKVRPSIDTRFSRADLAKAEIALNILGEYWGCLEREIRTADEAGLADAEKARQLSASATQACAEYRARAMNRVGYEGPDFGDFDLARDGGTAGAGTAEVLHNFQEFAIAYNIGLRGYRHRRAVELVTLPVPERK